METTEFASRPEAEEAMASRRPQQPMNTVVDMQGIVQPQQQSTPIKDHLIWSLFNAFYLNACCLGFLALIYSIKARDSKFVNNTRRARKFAAKAMGLNVAATLFSLTLLAAGLVYYLYVTVAQLTP
ncbi:dispanin subfamily A member 2b-like [Amblyraja radiata]|uniref:dispanin subfamily A member 2b-like n=1 Tax=Amblyraja radiata TaxID=386614 RepID=UPI0014041288|nr:dispanin subfamily A member 2b-like [Amblyraja radiata]